LNRKVKADSSAASTRAPVDGRARLRGCARPLGIYAVIAKMVRDTGVGDRRAKVDVSGEDESRVFGG
jgi:hypothetical protein